MPPPVPPRVDKAAKESSFATLTEANLLGRDEQENIQVINRISDGSEGSYLNKYYFHIFEYIII
jgi:hypothetical protein